MFVFPPTLAAIQIQGGDLIMSLPTASDSSYQLQRLADLRTGFWVNEGTSVAGNGGVLEVRHDGGALLEHQYYRMQATGL
jgi:hypothetical protein